MKLRTVNAGTLAYRYLLSLILFSTSAAGLCASETRASAIEPGELNQLQPPSRRPTNDSRQTPDQPRAAEPDSRPRATDARNPVPPRSRSQLSTLLGSPAAAGFSSADRPRALRFPEDHGPHPDFRNEWWYVTGNLDSEAGDRYGFELTFFRLGLAPAAVASLSAWRSNQLYMAHFTITDARHKRFYVAERFARGALGLAGAEALPLRVWIDNWQLSASPAQSAAEHWQLRAEDAEFGLQLRLVASKAPVLNGRDGWSQKSAEPGSASYYYSITRWQSDGQLRIGSNRYDVSGLAWLDREWSSNALAADQQGWDWFALQLADGSELMLYNLRKTDGTRDDYSAGTWTAADGRSSHLAADQFKIQVTQHWTSPAGVRYPAGWHIQVAEQQLSLRVTPIINEQELTTTVRYWEGAVDVGGSRAGAPLKGRGYVELTGYAD